MPQYVPSDPPTQISDIQPQPSYFSREQRTASSFGDSAPETVFSGQTYDFSQNSGRKSSSYSQQPISASLESFPLQPQLPRSTTSLSTYSHGNAFSASQIPTSRFPTSSERTENQTLGYDAPSLPRPVPVDSSSTPLSELTRRMLDRVREEQTNRLIDLQIKSAA